MARLLKKGDLTDEEIDGLFDNETYRAVHIFQSQKLGQHGQTLPSGYGDVLD